MALSLYLEEFAKCDVVKTVGTVEHYTLLCHRLGQILRRFRFSGSGGSFGSTTEMQVQCTKQSST